MVNGVKTQRFNTEVDSTKINMYHYHHPSNKSMVKIPEKIGEILLQTRQSSIIITRIFRFDEALVVQVPVN